MNYILEHWNGLQPLKQSFWINLFSGLVIVYVIGYLLQLILKPNTNLFIPAIIAYFAIFHVIFFIWQAIGTLRACDKNISQYIATGWTRAAQFGVIVSFAAVLIWGITLGQTIQRLKIEEQQRLAKSNVEPTYELKVTADNKLQINGFLDQGITREAKKLLLQNNDIEIIVLNSKGGNIYEARGLAKLIEDNNFFTHVDSDCFSACTTVFIAGILRTAGQKAKFGFHQYKLDSKKLFHTSLNIKDEQGKDLKYFSEKKVDINFLEKAFSTPFETMWFPTQQELINAGIIHKVI